MILNSAGKAVEQAILAIPKHYPGTRIDKYIVMPNHIHVILSISEGPGKGVSISRIVGQFKRAVTIRLREAIWQQGYFDHVIRCDGDYQRIWEYIDNNPLKWVLDKYYREG